MKKLIATTAILTALTAGSVFAEVGTDKGEHFKQRHEQFEQTLSKLPKEKADLVRTAFKDKHETGKANFAKQKELRKQMKDLALAEKFDKTAYLAKAKESAALRESSDVARAESIANVAEKLTAQERKTLFEGMFKKHGKKPEVETKS